MRERAKEMGRWTRTIMTQQVFSDHLGSPRWASVSLASHPDTFQDLPFSPLSMPDGREASSRGEHPTASLAGTNPPAQFAAGLRKGPERATREPLSKGPSALSISGSFLYSHSDRYFTSLRIGAESELEKR